MTTRPPSLPPLAWTRENPTFKPAGAALAGIVRNLRAPLELKAPKKLEKV